jgi:energy-coupling factor transporter ATP-binding protein EcfA2
MEAQGSSRDSGNVNLPVASSFEELHQKLLSGTIDMAIGPPVSNNHPEYFVGREKEIDNVLELLGEGKSVWIHGEQRAGKSSLLNRLSMLLSQKSDEIGVMQLNMQDEVLILKDEVDDIKSTRFAIKDLWHKMSSKNKQSQQETISRAIAERIKKLSVRKDYSKNTVLVCLIDEVGSTNLNYIETLPEAIISALPHLRQVRFILAGHKPLNQLSEEYQGKHDSLLPKWYPKDEIFVEPAIPKSIREKLGIEW